MGCFGVTLTMRYNMKKICEIVILTLLLTFITLPENLSACVGKTIVIGAKDTSTVQRMVDEIVALLINERTGTSVKLLSFDNAEACRKAILSSEVDIYVEYTGSALTEVLKVMDTKDDKEVFKLVKKQYKKKFNLIWLSPYGFDHQDGLKSEYKDKGFPAIAAPVVRKDTLKKFPALARLLKKLNGKITNEKLEGMLKSIAGDNYKAVARKFLKDNRLI
jgi:osmoprotectant transport system substrate-binding protein